MNLLNLCVLTIEYNYIGFLLIGIPYEKQHYSQLLTVKMENKNLTTSHVNPDDAERIKNTTSDNCSEVVNAQSTERLSIRSPNTN